MRYLIALLLCCVVLGCKNKECAEACKRASDDAIGSCEGEACKAAVEAYDKCLKACDAAKK